MKFSTTRGPSVSQSTPQRTRPGSVGSFSLMLHRMNPDVLNCTQSFYPRTPLSPRLRGSAVWKRATWTLGVTELLTGVKSWFVFPFYWYAYFKFECTSAERFDCIKPCCFFTRRDNNWETFKYCVRRGSLTVACSIKFKKKVSEIVKHSAMLKVKLQIS